MTPTTGDTWGITGPAFLGLFWLLGFGVIGWAVLVRRFIRTRRPTQDSTDWLDAWGSTDPYLAAYLNGGADLALLAALTALRADGLVRGRQRRCERVGEPPLGARPALELAILAETGHPVSRAELAKAPAVVEAMAQLRGELVRRRLLLSEEQRTRMRRASLPLLGLLVLGLARLYDGIGAGKPVSGLVVSLFLATVVLGALHVVLKDRTSPGDRALARLRANHQPLAPAMQPSWAANGATAAALGVAVFGTTALWTADPAFADDLAVAKSAYGPPTAGSSSGGSDSGGSGGSGCSGGGGCGGGGGGGCGG